MHINQRAQITFFILLGFAILLALGISTILLSGRTEKRTEQTMLTTKTPLRIQPIKDDINNCLTITAKEALVLLGKQGGYLYQSQGSTTPDTTPTDYSVTYTEFDQQKTRYLVDEPIGDIQNIFYSTPPMYPWERFPYTDTSSAEEQQSTTFLPPAPTFGASGAQPTTQPSSADLAQTQTEQYTGYYGINQLPYLYRPAPNSLQEQLEAYIGNNTKECVKFENYQGLQITSTNLQATLFIANETKKLRTEEAVHFTLTWPITIKDSTTNTTTTISDFGTTLYFPLAKIYYNITTIINKDVTNISYEPTNEGNYVITTTPIDKDSLIIVKFPATFIDDKQYEFRFVRHTRHPALHIIKELKKAIPARGGEFFDTIRLPYGSKASIAGNQLTFNPSDCNGQTQTIQLTASDPDGTINNNNIIFKLNPQQPKLDKLTGDELPKEMQVVAQKQNNPDKKDYQTFYAYIYCCPNQQCP